MALSDKKYERMFSTTGSDADKVETSAFNEIKADFDSNSYIDNVGQFKELGPVIYQIQNIQDELDYLRGLVDTNKSKVSMALGTSDSTALAGDTSLLALGTSGSTALAGDTTTISSSQASAITANTAKVSLVGGSKTTLSFGEMITTVGKKGTTYHIIMTATSGKVSKTVQLTLT